MPRQTGVCQAEAETLAYTGYKSGCRSPYISIYLPTCLPTYPPLSPSMYLCNYLSFLFILPSLANPSYLSISLRIVIAIQGHLRRPSREPCGAQVPSQPWAEDLGRSVGRLAEMP